MNVYDEQDSLPSLRAKDGLAGPPREVLRKLRKRALPVAAAGAAVCTIGALFNPTQFLRSYLLAFVFWISIALGALAIEMLQHVARGGWGVMLRRPLEAASRTIVKLAPLFLPLLAGLSRVYPWADPEIARTDAIIAQKSGYLNVPFFIARAVVYFAAWCGFAHVLSRMSIAQDRTGDPTLSRRMRLWSAIGLVAYCLTMTLASIDWMMSLTPHWYSTIYGVYIIGGQAVSAMSFAVLLELFLSEKSSLSGALRTQHFHDFGKMLLAFVMLWAYFAFSQLLIMWSGNLPEEVPYYIARARGGWWWVSIALIVFHFALPFLLLISRDLKRSRGKLAVVAGLLLVMRWVDLYWLIVPAWSPGGASLHWLDIATTIALGAVFFYLFAGELAQRPLLPLREPLLKEALHDG